MLPQKQRLSRNKTRKAMFEHFHYSISLFFKIFIQSLRPYKNLIIFTILFFLSIVKDNRKFFIFTNLSPFSARYSSLTDG